MRKCRGSIEVNVMSVAMILTNISVFVGNAVGARLFTQLLSSDDVMEIRKAGLIIGRRN